MTDVVDVDDPATWPDDLASEVDHWADELRGATPHTVDLRFPDDAEDAFRHGFLRGRLLRTHHCTRFLDREVELVRERGLRLLTEEFVKNRIAVAKSGGHLSEAEASLLCSSQVFASGRHKSRAGQVWLIAGDLPFEEETVHGVWRLLTVWGGEGINFDVEAGPLRERLKCIGTPSVVVALVDVSEGWNVHSASPGILHAFVGTRLRLSEPGAELCYTAPVPADQIEDIWQPGHSKYDAFPVLPQE